MVILYINFYPYIYVKDLVAFFALVLSLSIFIFYFPSALGEPDNYLGADPYSIPANIVPEWYFLSFYDTVRVIPNKVGGILAMGGAIVMFFLYPLLNTCTGRAGSSEVAS